MDFVVGVFGATEVTPQATTFYGDRGGRIRDPFGDIWWIQSRIEVVDDVLRAT